MSDPRRWTSRASEAAVIVASILLAFWIDAWWGERQAPLAEATTLQSIHEEAEANRAELGGSLSLLGVSLDRTDRFLASEPRDLRSVPADSVSHWLEALIVTWTFDGDVSAANLFLDSSTPVTDRGAGE